jgi:hypothetical protein
MIVSLDTNDFIIFISAGIRSLAINRCKKAPIKMMGELPTPKPKI